MHHLNEYSQFYMPSKMRIGWIWVQPVILIVKTMLNYLALDFTLVNLATISKKKNPLSNKSVLGNLSKMPSFGSWNATALQTHFATSVTKASWMESKASSDYMESHSKGKHVSRRRASHLLGVPAMSSEFDVSIGYMLSVEKCRGCSPFVAHPTLQEPRMSWQAEKGKE